MIFVIVHVRCIMYVCASLHGVCRCVHARVADFITSWQRPPPMKRIVLSSFAGFLFLKVFVLFVVGFLCFVVFRIVLDCFI